MTRAERPAQSPRPRRPRRSHPLQWKTARREGRKVAPFTTAEEAAVELTAVVPFLLEDKLKAAGGVPEPKTNFQGKRRSRWTP